MSRLSGREQAVWDKRNAGLTFKQIAKDLGLCVQTVSFAYRKAKRKVEYEKERFSFTNYEEIGTVAEFKELKQENVRLANLCDKLNKDYFEQKNIAADALKELTTQIRDQKLYKTRTCNLDKNYLCSLCGASQADIRKKYSNFCSNCGAKIIE